MNTASQSAEGVRWRLFVVFVVAAVLLLVLDSTGYLSTVIGYARAPFVVVQSWISGRAVGVRETLTATNDVFTLQAENQQLRGRVAELERQVEDLQEIYAEYTLLSTLMDYSRGAPEYRRVAADVMAWDSSNVARRFLINKGTRDGIGPGMPVETERGLVGRVVEAGVNSAQVQLLTDPSSSVNVRLGASRAEGVAVGQLNDPIIIKWIEQDIPVSENELVMTSGLGGNFPPDLVVGRVAKVEQSTSELFQEAEMRPAVDFDSLEIVLVIIDFEPVTLETEAQVEP